MAKHDGIKLPKRVAGIKIPKVIRKGPIGQFLNSRAGQVVLAETIVAAAAAFTAVKADPDSATGETLRHPVEGARRAGHAVAATGVNETERLAHAFREASRAFRDALQQDSFFAVWRDDDADDGSKAKKKSYADAKLH